MTWGHRCSVHAAVTTARGKRMLFSAPATLMRRVTLPVRRVAQVPGTARTVSQSIGIAPRPVANRSAARR